MIQFVNQDRLATNMRTAVNMVSLVLLSQARGGEGGG
jgi:hypothetical protein